VRLGRANPRGDFQAGESFLGGYAYAEAPGILPAGQDVIEHKFKRRLAEQNLRTPIIT
jgi:hypothetical protein